MFVDSDWCLFQGSGCVEVNSRSRHPKLRNAYYYMTDRDSVLTLMGVPLTQNPGRGNSDLEGAARPGQCLQRGDGNIMNSKR